MRSTAEDPGEGPSGTRATSTATQDVSNPKSTTFSQARFQPTTPAQALQARATQLADEVKVLQRIKELEQEKEELMAQLQPSRSQAPTPSEPEHQQSGQDLSAKRPISRNSVSSSEDDVKMKHVIIFTLNFSIQRRALWLSDLQRAFRSSKKRFSRKTKRIAYALDHMDEDCRQRWDQRLRENPEEEDTLLEDWDRFEAWTLTLLKDAQHQDTYFRSQLESARQGENQTPWEFHNYLSSLEDQFHRLPESERALAFLAKLRPELRRHIELYGGTRPETRLGMVNLAQSYWDQLRLSNQKKHIRQDSQKSLEYSKKSRKIHKNDREVTHSSSTANRSIRSGREVQNQGSGTSAKSQDRQYPTGYILRCFECNSDTHLIKDCPQAQAKKASTQAVVTGSKKGKKQQGNVKAT